MANSSIPKHTLTFRGKKTSVSLEDEFWDALKEIARKRGKPISHVAAAAIAQQRERPINCSSALRLFVLDYYQGPASDAE
jgi:predicted DNA-binding ribbon-helix-helix protein